MASVKKLLSEIQWKDCKTFVPRVEFGKVIKVYDGDSITIATMFQDNGDAGIYRFSVRLNGIDTPEMRTRNLDEKKVAQFVQQRLEDKLLGKFVTLKNVQLEKYGRLLCDVYLEEESNQSINDWLLENNFAVVYDGGTKNSPDKWSEYLALKHNNFV
tara:strand:- start:816 stop:1286 length:471 start_codon:yes stop_codon:yes gene_type:complete